MPRFDARIRRGFTLRPHIVTWHVCVFAIHPVGHGRPAYVVRGGGEVATFLEDVDAGRLDAELRAVLAHPPRRKLRRAPRDHAGTRVGVEHEYRVLDRSGAPVDFRSIIHGLGIDGVRADPSDPNAYRCPWGGVITCDGHEAEVATPPVDLGPGFVGRVITSTEDGRRALEAVLPGGLSLEGYSTHMNVSLHSRRDDRLARRFARTFGPALVLLLDRAESPGLLVRPRPGRLELCGEFADGAELAAALGLAVGGGLALRSLTRRQRRRLGVDCRLERAVERYGWFLGRDAVATDLPRTGRSAPLRRKGGWIPAGAHLAETWAVAEQVLRPLVGLEDLAPATRAVSGVQALPRERL